MGASRDGQKGWKWDPSVKNELCHYCIGPCRTAFETSHCPPHPNKNLLVVVLKNGRFTVNKL